MAKSIKNKKIVFLFPSKAIKSRIVLNSIIDNQEFYDRFEMLLCLDSSTGQNYSLALEHNFNILVVDRNLAELEYVDYDFLISCGWGWKINDKAIFKSTIASLNCHSSFLPDYKGASVSNHYWANCEEYSGATIHFLSKEFDTGNILIQEKVSISIKDKPLDILKKVSELTSILLMEAILRAENGDMGIVQGGNGRYFYKADRLTLYFHRVINVILKTFNLRYRYLTRYK